MTADHVTYGLLLAAVPPVNLFWVTYVTTTQWYRSHVGRSLVVSATGLAALIDISFLLRVFGADYQGRDAARIIAFSVIVVGCWYQFAAFLVERRRGRKRTLTP